MARLQGNYSEECLKAYVALAHAEIIVLCYPSDEVAQERFKVALEHYTNLLENRIPQTV